MSDVASLARSLMALDDKLASCMKCGFCQAFCPVHEVTGHEADLPRGKIALVENLAHMVLQDAEAVQEKLARCLLCGTCQANCPSGVPTIDIFLEAKAIVTAYLGLPPLKKAIFRALLPNPRLFHTLMRVGAPLQQFVLQDEQNPQKTACAPMLEKILGNRHMPKLASAPLRAKVGRLDTPTGKSGLRVAFYPGCMGDKIYTDMSEACLKVLAHHGVGVFLSDNYACCGIPALVSGERDGLEKMIAHNVDILRQETFDYILTPCSSCTMTIREFWPKMCQGLPYAYQSATRDFAAKCMDINAFLVDVLQVRAEEAGQGSLRVTFHDSCHLKKSLGITQQPRELVRMNKDCSLVEMPEADSCCGCGGSFTLTHYDLSQKIGQRKRENVIASGADVVATGCPACMMQLSDMLARNNDPVRVRHCIEIYADSLGL